MPGKTVPLNTATLAEKRNEAQSVDALAFRRGSAGHIKDRREQVGTDDRDPADVRQPTFPGHRTISGMRMPPS